LSSALSSELTGTVLYEFKPKSLTFFFFFSFLKKIKKGLDQLKVACIVQRSFAGNNRQLFFTSQSEVFRNVSIF